MHAYNDNLFIFCLYLLLLLLADYEASLKCNISPEMGTVQVILPGPYKDFQQGMFADTYSGLILGLRPANERRPYFETTSLIGWSQT